MARDPWLDALEEESEAFGRWRRELGRAEPTPHEVADLIEIEPAVSRLRNRLAARLDRIVAEQRAGT